MGVPCDEPDLLDPRVLADPYATYALLRDRAPVYEMPGTGHFVLTRYAEVEHVLREPGLFARDLGLEPDPARLFHTPQARERLGQAGVRAASPLRADKALRDAARARLHACVPSHWEAAEPCVRAIVGDLLQRLAARGECDFVSELCVPLPLMVMADRLGLSLEELPRLASWSRSWLRPFAYAMPPAQELELAAGRGALRSFLAEELASRRRAPRRDLLSDLAHAGGVGEGPELADESVLALCEELLFGGNDAVSDALASGLLWLFREPALLHVLRADASRLPVFVDEILRLESPVAGVLRRATRDTQLLDVKIPEGRLVHARIGAANRDPRRFAHADLLDLCRPDAASHLAFGRGSDACPGASLARLQLRVAFEQLLARWRHVELAVKEQELEYLPTFLQRSLRELPIRMRQ